MKIKYKQIDYVIIFCLFLVSCGFVPLSLPGILQIFLSLLLLLPYFFFIKIKINQSSIVLFILMILFMGLSFASNNENDLYQYIIVFISLICSIIYTSFVTMNNFLKSTQKVIYWICIISLIIYVVYYIAPSIINMFPTVINKSGTVAKNVLFFPVILNSDPIKRNYGIFWEPGVFQLFINFTLLIELFYYKSITKKSFVVYTLTILTTVSTTGIIVYILICMFFYIHNNQNIVKKVEIAVMISIFFIIIITILPDTYFSRVFNKLIPFLDFNISDLNPQTPVRIKAIIYPFLLFLDNPIFGVGLTKLINSMNEYKYVMTFTLLNIFSEFGILYGFLLSSSIYMFFSKFCHNHWEKITIFMIFMIFTSTEELSRNIVFFILVIYGFKILFNKERSLNEREQRIDY